MRERSRERDRDRERDRRERERERERELLLFFFFKIGVKLIHDSHKVFFYKVLLRYNIIDVSCVFIAHE